MPFKRFRNVKWDKQKDFRKSLAKYELNEDAYELIDIVSNKNIIVTTFNSLLREADIDYKKHLNESNLIKLYTALTIVDFVELKDRKTIISEIKKAVKKLTTKEANKAKDVETINWEERLLNRFNFDDEKIKAYFSSDKYYENVAKVFSNPFNDQRYYDFAYLFNMYISIEAVFNKYNVSDDINIFLIKLEVQQKMIEVLKTISPKNFNTIIINMNKWIVKFDKKFYELVTRKAGN